MQERTYALTVRLSRLSGQKENHEPSVVFILRTMNSSKSFVASGDSIEEAYRNIRMLEREWFRRRNPPKEN